jgi:hypothetical protein
VRRWPIQMENEPINREHRRSLEQELVPLRGKVKRSVPRKVWKLLGMKALDQWLIR